MLTRTAYGFAFSKNILEFNPSRTPKLSISYCALAGSMVENSRAMSIPGSK
jgi:hypothetical protein